jgi:hypothetical protein
LCRVAVTLLHFTIIFSGSFEHLIQAYLGLTTVYSKARARGLEGCIAFLPVSLMKRLNQTDPNFVNNFVISLLQRDRPFSRDKYK